MNRRNNGNGWFWFILIIFIFSGGAAALFPLFLIVAIVLGITFAAAASNNRSQRNQSSYRRSYNNTTNYYRPSSQNKYTAAQMAKINVYLRSWFKTRRSLPIGSDFNLRIHGSRYASLASLDVYQGNRYICSLNDFGKRYPESYDEILTELVKISSTGKPEDIIDVDVEEAKQPNQQAQATPKKEEEKKGAQYFMDQIESLNNDIPDEGISNGLHETYALLKQIQTLELKFPNSKAKLDKLYEYYLPILIRILKQYDNLQAAQMDPSYAETKDKLNRTISLINDAMKTIITSMTDQDFINLSADISTLEAVLQKDGLTADGRMESQQSSGDES